MSETVGEFPELQGIIGRYIALAQGEKPAIADAIAEHYKPQGPSDAVPSNPVSIAVALADKLDMLVGFWAIDEKPTGSKDPFALRRAALGVIRIILERKLRLRLRAILVRLSLELELELRAEEALAQGARDRLGGTWPRSEPRAPRRDLQGDLREIFASAGHRAAKRRTSLLEFFGDRLKVYLRDQGARHDLIDAVFALPGQDDLLDDRAARRGAGPLPRYGGRGEPPGAGPARAQHPQDRGEEGRARASTASLLPSCSRRRKRRRSAPRSKPPARRCRRRSASEDFEAAMAALAKLRAPVDAFFDKVTVNADKPEIRENRLMLLAQIRALTLEIADFSKIEG